MQLSEHFSLGEFTFSQTAVRLGIANTAPDDIIPRLLTVARSMERVRKLLGDRPVRISSVYRSDTLNKAVGGSKTSAHCEGWAVDFTCDKFGSPRDVAEMLVDSDIKFDQLILEFPEANGWVHISFDPSRGLRRSVLTAKKVGKETVYERGLV